MPKNENNLYLSKIAKELDIQLVGGNGNETFNEISIDSRTLQPNDIFVALKGHLNDGHDYLIEAVEKGTNKIHEAADVLYHLMVFLEANGIKIEDVMNELKKRQK